MEGLVVIVGLFVAVGTPLGTYFAARQGHKVTERTARLAAETARDAATLTAQAAAATIQTTREEHGRSHIRWACEKAWSPDPATQSGGIAILKSMLLDNQLDHGDLVMIAGVLESLTADAVGRVGQIPPLAVAGPAQPGDAGDPAKRSQEQGSDT